MATIKSFASLEQSKKLAEILPIESADMVIWGKDLDAIVATDAQKFMKCLKDRKMNYIPCWSLAALFDVLPDGTDIIKDKTDTENEKYMCTVGVKDDIICTFGNNPVDACVAMIEKLHELNLL